MGDIPLTAAEPQTMEQIRAGIQIDVRLKTAYATAMAHQHGGGCVEIHLGRAVIDYLKSLMSDPPPDAEPATVYGFPVVKSDRTPDHISIHAVTPIL